MMETTSQTSCSPYRDVIQERPGTLVRQGKQCASCAFVLRYALNVHFSVYVKKGKEKRRHFLNSVEGWVQCFTSGLLSTHNNATYQIPLFLLFAFQLLCQYFQSGTFYKCILKWRCFTASHEMFWNCDKKKQHTTEKEVTVAVCRCVIPFERQKNMYFIPGKREGISWT